MEIGIQDIRTLIEWLDASSVGELSFEQGGTRLVLKKQPGTPAPVPAPAWPAPAWGGEPAPAPAELPPAPPAAPEVRCFVQKAPMVGTFYEAPSPESQAYVGVGSRVEAGQILCIIEAMKLMNEIEAEQSGVIRSVRIKNAQPVEFGQPLFEIETD